MMKKIFALLMAVGACVCAAAQAWQPGSADSRWQPDHLGDGFEMRYVDQGADYSGPVRSTVVRKLAPASFGATILYVHGYNDYFFQEEMADSIVAHGYDFYAVDLRKYGRSLMPGQRKFEVRDLHEYFADIDSALSIIKAEQPLATVVLMGHSTGGLITSLYMSEYMARMAQEPQGKYALVTALVLNSPFLDWNMGAFMRNVAIPAVAAIGSKHPGIEISNGNSTAYGESLLKSHHGEWEYNTDWKTFYPEKVTAGWIRAIDQGHSAVQHEACIAVPILLMHSDKSIYGDDWTPAHQQGDAVLNVDNISHYGRLLGCQVTELTVSGGLHDLFLSSPPVRRALYAAFFAWLATH